MTTTSVTTSLPLWLAGCTYDASGGDDLRNSGVTGYFYDEGIVTGSVIGVLGGVTGGAGLVVSAGTGMTVSVQPGSFVVPNSASPVSGGYVSTLSQQATLTVQTADPSNPRIDIVVAYVDDAGDSSSFGAIAIYTGTAAASPSAPSAPANSIILASVAVPANATSIAGGDLTDERPFTTAVGGILVAAPGTVTGYRGMAGFDVAHGRFYHNSNTTGDTQFKVLPWAPAYATRNSDLTILGTETTVASVGITTDGYTDIKITTHIVGIAQAYPTTEQTIFTVWLDGSQLDEIDLMTNSADRASASHLGFTSVYSTSSATGDTPSAGSHTVYFKGVTASPNATVLVATATRNAYLRVEPVVL